MVDGFGVGLSSGLSWLVGWFAWFGGHMCWLGGGEIWWGVMEWWGEYNCLVVFGIVTRRGLPSLAGWIWVLGCDCYWESCGVETWSWRVGLEKEFWDESWYGYVWGCG